MKLPLAAFQINQAILKNKFKRLKKHLKFLLKNSSFELQNIKVSCKGFVSCPFEARPRA